MDLEASYLDVFILWKSIQVCTADKFNFSYTCYTSITFKASECVCEREGDRERGREGGRQMLPTGEQAEKEMVQRP